MRARHGSARGSKATEIEDRERASLEQMLKCDVRFETRIVEWL